MASSAELSHWPRCRRTCRPTRPCATLTGDFAHEVARDSGQYRERAGANPTEYYGYAETGQAYAQYREGYGGGVEYRYADFPLALGEAIMMNHALFTGLLHVGATPTTDGPFHNQALSLKLHHAAHARGSRYSRAGSRIGCGHLRRGMAARLARRQENHARERLALSAKGLGSLL